jgi:hypothetical protein
MPLARRAMSRLSTARSATLYAHHAGRSDQLTTFELYWSTAVSSSRPGGARVARLLSIGFLPARLLLR